jgi:hypothetical protein
VRLPTFRDQHADHLLAEPDRHIHLRAPSHAVDIAMILRHIGCVVKLTIQQWTLAQPLSRVKHAWDVLKANARRPDTVACGLIHQEQTQHIVPQGFVQALDHTEADLILVQRSGEFGAEPEQGSLSRSLVVQGRGQTLSLRLGLLLLSLPLRRICQRRALILGTGCLSLWRSTQLRLPTPGI